MSDALYGIGADILQSATEAYHQALALMKQGKKAEGQQLQIWADTLRSAGEQIGVELKREEGRTTRLFVPYLGPSTNAIYAGIHWAKRKKAKDEALAATLEAVQRAGVMPARCQVDLVFRPRLGKGVRRRDTSNNSMTAKLIEDALVKAGVLPDDTEEHVRRVINEPPEIDRQAETGTWVEIIEIGEES